MPELPEVEVTRLGFADRIAGARIEAVRVGKPLRWALAVEPGALVGPHGARRAPARQVPAGRPGCRPAADASGHVGQPALRHRLASARAARPLRPGDQPRHAAPQRSAALRRRGLCAGRGAPLALKLLGGLGMEPLGEGFDLDAFHAGLRRRRAPIKQVLLAGDVVVGVGNIYASEALSLPASGRRCPPRASAGRAPRACMRRCARSWREPSSAAAARLRDFSNIDGQSGYFQLEATVYGRAGEPCRVCATPIRQLRQGQRSTYLLPKLSKVLKGRRPLAPRRRRRCYIL